MPELHSYTPASIVDELNMPELPAQTESSMKVIELSAQEITASATVPIVENAMQEVGPGPLHQETPTDDPLTKEPLSFTPTFSMAGETFVCEKLNIPVEEEQVTAIVPMQDKAPEISSAEQPAEPMEIEYSAMVETILAQEETPELIDVFNPEGKL